LQCVAMVSLLQQAVSFLGGGFDSNGKETGDSDGGAVGCPSFREVTLDERMKWRCGIELEDDTGRLSYDPGCVRGLKQKIFWGYEGGDECKQYWGDPSRGRTGLWHRIAGRAGAQYYSCMSREVPKMLNELPPNKAQDLDERGKLKLQLEADRKCKTKELCTLQNSHFGYCSRWYREEVAVNCSDDWFYRKRFCSRICPPPPVSKPETLAAKPDESEPQSRVDAAVVSGGDGEPQKQSKCPVKRVAWQAKEKAEEACEIVAETAKDVAKWVKRMLPLMIASPAA